ncbi:MAG TPA: LytR C-terminal domain-containing protein [Actinomycetes bacterium]|nr:LytR C-terminal domain-containing protein [Actinomycetes bacterium]
MATPEPPPEGDGSRARGAHRAEQPPSRSLLLPLLAVLAVLAGLGLAGYMLLANQGADDSAQPLPSSGTPADSGLTPSTEPATTGSTKEPTSQPTKEPTNQPTKQPTKQPTDEPSKEPTDQSVPSIPVYVFNQTTLTGLASQVASEFESVGWNVVGVDNWRGFVPEDTVYYYPGDKAEAQQLSRQFPEIARVWPASSPMPGNALTVILATTNRK